MSTTGQFIADHIDLFPKVPTIVGKPSSVLLYFENGREILLPKEDEDIVYEAVEKQRVFFEAEKASRLKASGWTVHWEPDDIYSL